MNPLVLGGLLGLAAAAGLALAVRSAPPLRPIRLADRMAPYLGDTPAPSRLLERPAATAAPFTVARRLFGPALRDAVRVLDRLLGGSRSVRRRLDGIGRDGSVEEFRVEQVAWAACGLLAGALLGAAVGLARGHVQVLPAALAALGGALAGVLARDWSLSRALRRREEAMLAEFPVVADLLALAVLAGEAPAAALARVCRLGHGELVRDLDAALARSRAGIPLTTALADLSARTTLEPFARFLDGLTVALERGTPLAELLRAQALDVREARKRALLEAGGRKEISMMVPVVFLILPVTVLFALYPGLMTLTSLAR